MTGPPSPKFMESESASGTRSSKRTISRSSSGSTPAAKARQESQTPQRGPSGPFFLPLPRIIPRTGERRPSCISLHESGSRQAASLSRIQGSASGIQTTRDQVLIMNYSAYRLTRTDNLSIVQLQAAASIHRGLETKPSQNPKRSCCREPLETCLGQCLVILVAPSALVVPD